MWRREWLGRRDADERRRTDDTNAIVPDCDRSDAIDPDCDRPDAIDFDGDRPDSHGVPNDNRRRSFPATRHDDELRRNNNVRSESRRRRGRSGLAERRIEQYAMGLDRVRDSRGGGPHRRNCLVVA